MMRKCEDHTERTGIMKEDVKNQIEEFIKNNPDKFKEYKGYDTYMRNKRIIDNSDLPKDYVSGRSFLTNKR